MNIRGLVASEKWLYLKKVVVKEDIQMICIQETKSNRIITQKCYDVLENNNMEWKHNVGENKEGGILMIWNGSRFQVRQRRSNKGYIILKRVYGIRKQLITVTNVYPGCSLNENLVL